MGEYNQEKVDEVVLALLYLSLYDENRAWKEINREAQNRLYKQGWIENSWDKNESIVLTPEGLERAKSLFEQYFGK